MKIIRDFLKRKIRIVGAFLFGAFLFGGITTGVTASIAANSVVYVPPSGSSIASTNVEDALNNLYVISQSLINPDNMGLPLYYEFGMPTTSSTQDVSGVGKNVFVGLYSDEQYGICLRKNGVYCFRINNWVAEAKHMLKVFSDSGDTCSVFSDSIECSSSRYVCLASSTGVVNCRDYVVNVGCLSYNSGTITCSQ